MWTSSRGILALKKERIVLKSTGNLRTCNSHVVRPIREKKKKVVQTTFTLRFFLLRYDFKATYLYYSNAASVGADRPSAVAVDNTVQNLPRFIICTPLEPVKKEKKKRQPARAISFNQMVLPSLLLTIPHARACQTPRRGARTCWHGSVVMQTVHVGGYLSRSVGSNNLDWGRPSIPTHVRKYIIRSPAWFHLSCTVLAEKKGRLMGGLKQFGHIGWGERRGGGEWSCCRLLNNIFVVSR